jgi:Phosphate transport (Pho88)
MLTGLASSFLSSQSTVLEYDLKQAHNMQGGLIFNMLFMWFLHFKLKQIQPLLVQTVTGVMSMVYSPLFQVYCMGRNLERPFKTSSSPWGLPPPTSDSDEAADAELVPKPNEEDEDQVEPNEEEPTDEPGEGEESPEPDDEEDDSEDD